MTDQLSETRADAEIIWECIYDHGNGKHKGEKSAAQRAEALAALERLKAQPTPQPAALPELLREIVAYCREAGHDWSNLAEAEHMLATLQAQPAEVSDATINRLVYEHTKLNPNQADDLDLLLGFRNAVRAILALRPQAVPMSRKELGEATARAHIAFCLAKFDTYEEALMAEFQAHHGITAPAGGEGKA